MPMLATLLVSIFNGLVNFFAAWMSKKIALGVAAVALFSTLTLGLWAAIGLSFTGLVAMIPSDSAILIGLWVAVPDNAQPCIAATIAADTAIALYRWNVENLRLMAYIT